MQETLEVTAQPNVIGVLYKDARSKLVILAKTEDSGIVVSPDQEAFPNWFLGDYMTDLPPFNDTKEWEYFIGEIVICNPAVGPTDNSEEEQ